MSGVHGENVAFPFAGGEAHPCVRGISGRMRTAVHPDGSELRPGADVVLDSNDLLCLGVLLLPNAEIERPAINIWRDVDAALLFPKGKSRRIPTFRPLARRVVDGQPEIVNEF